MNSRQFVGGKALRIEPLRLFGIRQQRSRAIVTHTLANARKRSIQPDGNTSLVNDLAVLRIDIGAATKGDDSLRCLRNPFQMLLFKLPETRLTEAL